MSKYISILEIKIKNAHEIIKFNLHHMLPKMQFLLCPIAHRSKLCLAAFKTRQKKFDLHDFCHLTY